MPTFQVQIPAKLILFGEWAVLFEKKAIGCTLGKYFSVSLEKSLNEEALTIESPEIKFEWKTALQSPPPFLENAVSILKNLFDDPLDHLKGQHLKLTRNWKLSEGLGSSSALYLGLYLLHQKSSSHPDKIDLHSIKSSLVAFQKGGSGFDILLQAKGGICLAETHSKHSQIDRLSLDIPKEILFVHTGKKMKTNVAISQLSQSQELKLASDSISKSVDQFLVDLDWQKCMREHHLALSQLGVVPPFVQELRDEWLNKQWITELKTTGAGGGDTLMLLINPHKKEEILNDIKTKGFWTEESKLGVKGALDAISS